MKKLLISLLSLMVAAVAVSADGLVVSSADLAVNEPSEYNIELTIPEGTVTAYQFLLTLPDGLTLAKDALGDYRYSLSSLHSSDHTATITTTTEGRYAFVVYSPTNTVLSGTTGTLITLMLQPEERVKGQQLTGNISKIQFSAPDGTKILQDDLTFIVNVVYPVITVNHLTREYGEVNPELTYMVSGPALRGEPLLTTTAVPNSSVGEYPIKAERGTIENAYYEIVNGSLTVKKAVLTIEAQDAQYEYGDEWHELSATYIGFKNGETQEVLTTKPLISCEGKNVGNYPIIATGAEAQNYEITYVNGTMSITKAPLKIIVNDARQEYGEPQPIFTFTYEGFKNQESEAVLKQQASSTCDGVNVGSYPIKGYGAEAENYEISYQDGTLTITKAPLNITVNDAKQEYGDPQPTFTFTYEGFKNRESEAVLRRRPVGSSEGVNVGSYPITCNGAEAENYEITYTNGTLTITKAPLTITVNDVEQEYGETQPAFTFTYKGFKNGETESVLKQQPVGSCDGLNVGSYPILCNGAEADNYEISYQEGTLTVTKASLKITVNDANVEYGDPQPTFTFTYEGFKNDETESVLKQQPSGSCDGVNVGSYAITCNGAEADNYEISYQNGTLTITKAQLNITVNDANQEYGDPQPTFTFTYEGFKNDETESVLKRQPFGTSNGVNVGSYPITCNGAEADNYEIFYQEGTLTVTKAPLNITVNDASVEYGNPQPSFTFTYEGFKNSETESVLKRQPEGTCDGVNVGSYPIVGNGAEAENYEISYLNGTLTITKAPLNITVNDAYQEYGDPQPSFTFTYEGFKNDETESVLKQQPVGICDGVNVGSYAITCNDAEADNYEISYQEGTLTITKAPLKIIVNDVEIEYGEVLSVFSFTYEGFKNQETETVLDALPVATCDGRKVGSYLIAVNNVTAQNYEITLVNGTLTITPAPLTVKAKDVSRYDGIANPVFELEYSGWKYDDDISVLKEIPVVHTEADENSLPGDYDIIVSGGLAENYAFIYEVGILTVLQLPSYVVPYNNMTFHIPDALVPEVMLKVATDMTHVVIPSTVQYRGKEWTVTAVADSVFAGRKQLVTVEIPYTVKAVGKDVFDGCTHLAAIVWRAPVNMTSEMMGKFNNPNLLLYMADEANALENVTNVIDLSSLTAKHIVLKDDEGTNDFYCPMEFTANEISYTHEYKQDTKSGSSQGWESLVLPFDVAEVMHQEKGNIYPFAKLTQTQIIDGEKPFWLYAFTPNGFVKADAIRANTPYIISMPNEKDLWDDYILEGQVTFRATNAKVRATFEASSVQGNNKTFTPNYRKESSDDYFLLNVRDKYNGYAEGSVFAKGRRGAHPFEAYFTTTADVKEFGVFDEVASGISDNSQFIFHHSQMDGPVYDMQGRKIVNSKMSKRQLPKGLYIINGKKVSVK